MRACRRRVGVLPVDRSGNIILVRQFRYPYDTELLEIPAGKLDHGAEDFTACGAGAEGEYRLHGWPHRAAWRAVPSPGFLTEVVHLFAALDLTEEMQPDEDEFVEVVRLPIAEVEAMIARDEIRDAKTIVAMYRARLKGLL